MFWHQCNLTLPAFSRGFHLVTDLVEQAIPELQQVDLGLLHLFIQHTSASLTINENADPDVPKDLESSLSAIAPEDFPHTHTMEGPDDMPAHLRSVVTNTSEQVPVTDGSLALGTWQGIYLWEHRRRGSCRSLCITVCGESA